MIRRVEERRRSRAIPRRGNARDYGCTECRRSGEWEETYQSGRNRRERRQRCGVYRTTRDVVGIRHLTDGVMTETRTRPHGSHGMNLPSLEEARRDEPARTAVEERWLGKPSYTLARVVSRDGPTRG